MLRNEEFMCRRLPFMVDVMLTFASISPFGKSLNVLPLLFKFAGLLSAKDGEFVLNYFLKGEKSIWTRIENHRRTDQMKVDFEYECPNI